LAAKQDEIDKIYNQIDSLISNYEDEIVQKWRTFVENNYPKYQQFETNGVGLFFPVNDFTVRVWISYDSQFLYCQVDTQHIENEDLPQEVIEKVGHLLHRKSGKNTIYEKFPGYDVYDKTFHLFCEVMKNLTCS